MFARIFLSQIFLTVLLCQSGRIEASESLTGGSVVHTGHWLRQGNASVFVALHPRPRVLRYLPDGTHSPLLLLGEQGHTTGIRTWFFEDGAQTPDSPRPSNQPAVLIEQTATSLLLRSIWDQIPGKETAIWMRVELLPDDSLRIHHGVENLAEQQRRLAAWSISAFPPNGCITIPFDNANHRPITLFKETGVSALEKTLRPECLHINVAEIMTGHPLKFGVRASAGTISYETSTSRWFSTVPFIQGGDYPEGGANLTAFISSNRPPAWCEIEQVGPTKTLSSGQTTWLIETIVRITPDKPKQQDLLDTENQSRAGAKSKPDCP
jgi:hypothetical protein